MKKKLIILTIILCLITFFGGYYLTLMIDNKKSGGDLKINAVFEDSETYVIPSIKKMTKEEALLEWPYIVHLENNSDAKGLYQLIIKDTEKASIKRENLDYALYLDTKEVVSGKLKDIKDNILYTGEIEGNKKQEFKLYIWSTIDEEGIYEYKLEFTVIKDGGPGF